MSGKTAAMEISEDMGALLWRRYYEARAGLDANVSMLPETLRALLDQAGIPEPEDDVVFGPGGSVWHGRTMTIRRASRSSGEGGNG